MQILRVIAILGILAGAILAEATTRTSLCTVSGVPNTVGPKDSLYLMARGRCEEELVAFTFDRIVGGQVDHSVEFSVHRQPVTTLVGFDTFWKKDIWKNDQSWIVIIDPLGDLKVGSKYRLSLVEGDTRRGAGPLLLSLNDWQSRNGTESGSSKWIRTKSAFADFTVSEPWPEEARVFLPALTGHSLAREPPPNSNRFAIRLCASAPEGIVSPERYLYVIEILNSDDAWRWFAAWHPSDYGDRDARCAYVVGTDSLGPTYFSRSGEFTFRPMIIRSDGLRWSGQERTVPIDDAD